MIKKTVTVENESGLHARPAALLVKTAAKYDSDFRINMMGFTINGKSILGVLTLAAEHGAEMELELDGPDEEAAMKAIAELFEKKFEE